MELVLSIFSINLKFLICLTLGRANCVFCGRSTLGTWFTNSKFSFLNKFNLLNHFPLPSD